MISSDLVRCMHIHRLSKCTQQSHVSMCDGSRPHKSPRLTAKTPSFSFWLKQLQTIVLDGTIHRLWDKVCGEFQHKEGHSETIRGQQIAWYFSLSQSKYKHKFCPTLFGQSSWSTTRQISVELLQSSFSHLATPILSSYFNCNWYQHAGSRQQLSLNFLEEKRKITPLTLSFTPILVKNEASTPTLMPWMMM